MIAWKGDATAKLPGVLDENNDIPVFTLQANAQSKVSWKDKTADEVLADISAMLQQVNATTMNVEHPDYLALPSDTYIALSTKRIPDTNSTILTFLKENLPGIKDIVSCAELNANAVDTNPYAKASGARAWPCSTPRTLRSWLSRSRCPSTSTPSSMRSWRPSCPVSPVWSVP